MGNILAMFKVCMEHFLDHLYIMGLYLGINPVKEVSQLAGYSPSLAINVCFHSQILKLSVVRRRLRTCRCRYRGTIVHLKHLTTTREALFPLFSLLSPVHGITGGTVRLLKAARCEFFVSRTL